MTLNEHIHAALNSAMQHDSFSMYEITEHIEFDDLKKTANLIEKTLEDHGIIESFKPGGGIYFVTAFGHEVAVNGGWLKYVDQMKAEKALADKERSLNIKQAESNIKMNKMNLIFGLINILMATINIFLFIHYSTKS
jgi:hypothetical protein